jgi:hypothetical protein
MEETTSPSGRATLKDAARVMGCAVLGIVVGTALFAFGPHQIDDAYITFRYAQNLTDGQGLVFNVGERVQGFSSPLWTLLLGGFGAVGLPIPAMGFILSVLFGLATVALVVFVARAMGNELAGWFAATILSLQLFWVALAVGGMETTLFSFLALLTAMQVARRRWTWVGPLVGVALWVRPDAVLLAVAALAVTFGCAGRRMAIRQAIIGGAIRAPWLIFAQIHYGSMAPQSVVAKTISYAHFPWSEVLHHHLLFWSYQPLAWLWALFAIVGAVVLVRRERAWLALPLWMVSHLMALIIGRAPIMNFGWYMVPLLPPLFLLGATGLVTITRAVHREHRDLAVIAFSGAAGVLLGVQGVRLAELHRDYGARVMNRELAYQITGTALRPLLRPGDSILVGEVGAISWALPEAHVIDSAGLVSPKVIDLAKRAGGATDTGGGATLTRLIIDEMQPDFIASQWRFLALEEVRDEPWFTESYVQLEGQAFGVFDQVVFVRRDHPNAPRRASASI